MKTKLEDAVIQETQIPVLTNQDALPTKSPEDIRKKLALQIDHPVQWEKSIRYMIANGTELLNECGPGKVLSSLLRKIDRKKKVLNSLDEESFEQILQELKPNLIQS